MHDLGLALWGLRSGCDMDHVNLWGFYAVGGDIRQLLGLKGDTPVSEALIVLNKASLALTFLSEGSDESLHVERSFFAAKELLDDVNELSENIKSTLQPKSTGETPQYVVGEHNSNSIKEKLKAFEAVLRAELAYVHAYRVSEKGLFSTARLIESAEDGVGNTAKGRLTDIAKADIREAGRALAYDLYTASGFHALRALEAIVVDYIIRKKGSKPAKRDLGEYVALLTAEGADQDVTSTIDQIRRIRRNPLMHPEDSLDEETAIHVFQLCLSTITACIRDMDSKGLFDPPPPPIAATAVP